MQPVTIDTIRKLDAEGTTADVVAHRFRALGGSWTERRAGHAATLCHALTYGEDHLEVRVLAMRASPKRDELSALRLALRALRRLAEDALEAITARRAA